jgi:hypothetical protein
MSSECVRWRRLSVIAAAAAAILSAKSGNAAPLPSPIPDPSTVAIFDDLTSFSFDPVTHAYYATGPVAAVQLPGEFVVDTDPLITAGAIMTQSGTFTGTGINPFSSFDPTGQLLDYTIQIDVGGQLVFSETFPDMTLFATYTSGDSVTADFVGNASSKFVDLSVVNSPVLDFFEAGTSKGSDTYNWVNGQLVHNNSDIATPEPGSIDLLLFSVTALAILARRRRAPFR